MNKKEPLVQITTETFLKTAAVALLLVFLFLIKDIVVVVLLSVVIASGVEPAARWFQKNKIPRVLAVILVYAAAFLFLGAAFYLVIPTIFSEFGAFDAKLSAGLNGSVFGNLKVGPPSFLNNVISNLTTQASGYLSNFAGSFFQLAATIFGGAFSFVLIIVISFYLSVQENGIENFLRMIIPLDKEEYVVGLWQRAKRKIGYWLQGQILLGFIVGVLSYLGLTILRVDYALAFALLSGILELIPVFGPILSAVPPVITAFLVSPFLALEVAGLYLIIQQMENHLIYPLVVRKIIGISPILVILALVIGGKLGGFLGIILAVPVATVLSEVLRDIDIKKHNSMGHKKEDGCLDVR